MLSAHGKHHPIWSLCSVVLAALFWTYPALAQGSVVWTPTGPLPGAIQELWAAPGSTDVSYALSNGRLFRSDDGWASWSDVTTPDDLVDFAFVPSQPDSVYASTTDGRLLQSDDRAITWVPLDLPEGDVANGVFAVPSNPPALFVPIQSGDLLRSTDGGASWTSLNAPPEPGGGELYSHPLDPAVLWRVRTAMHYSDDLGTTWSTSELPGQLPIRHFALDPSNAARAYATEGLNLFRTDDGGASWVELGPLPLADSEDLDSLTASNDQLFLVIRDVFFGFSRMLQSTDGGQTWSDLTGSLPEGPATTRWIADGAVLVAFGHDSFSPLIVSENQGTTWQGYGDSIDSATVTDLAWTGNGYGALVIHSRSNARGESWFQTRRSADGGLTWQGTDLRGIQTPRGPMAVKPFDPHIVLLDRGEIFRSVNGGETWSALQGPVSDGPFNAVTDFAFDRQTPGRVLAASVFSVQLSTDSGATWSFLSSVPERIEGLAIDPTSGNHVIAYGLGALRSTDGGATWSAAETFPPNLQKVLFDTRRTAALYAVDFTNPTLFRSADNGNTWESRPLPAAGFVTDLAQDSAGHLWIAQGPENDNTDTAPYRSTDGGDTWERIDTGLPDGVAIRSFGPGPEGRMAAGTFAHGAYTLQNGPCESDATTACLLGGKFRVEASQRPLDDPSTSVAGRVMHFETARAESEQSVFFESFLEGTFEVGVKMVDGCGLPEGDPQRAFWVFFGGLTNAETMVRIDDLATGEAYVWNSPAGELAQSLGDTNALPCEVDNPPPPQPCVPVDDIACLFDGRFRVAGAMRNFDDLPLLEPLRVMDFAGGRAESDQSVFFETFQAGNFELGVKMIDACGLPADDPLRSYWVFYGGLTNAGSQVVVTQVDTGDTDTWTVFAGVLPRSEGRVSAFDCE